MVCRRVSVEGHGIDRDVLHRIVATWEQEYSDELTLLGAQLPSMPAEIPQIVPAEVTNETLPQFDFTPKVPRCLSFVALL